MSCLGWKGGKYGGWLALLRSVTLEPDQYWNGRRFQISSRVLLFEAGFATWGPCGDKECQSINRNVRRLTWFNHGSRFRPSVFLIIMHVFIFFRQGC